LIRTLKLVQKPFPCSTHKHAFDIQYENCPLRERDWIGSSVFDANTQNYCLKLQKKITWCNNEAPQWKRRKISCVTWRRTQMSSCELWQVERSQMGENP